MPSPHQELKPRVAGDGGAGLSLLLRSRPRPICFALVLKVVERKHDNFLLGREVRAEQSLRVLFQNSWQIFMDLYLTAGNRQTPEHPGHGHHHAHTNYVFLGQTLTKEALGGDLWMPAHRLAVGAWRRTYGVCHREHVVLSTSTLRG